MLKIIPAIDLLGGQCVRLKQGDYKQKTSYHSDPIKVAQQIQSDGFTHVHVVDLDGAKGTKMMNGDVVSRICSETSLKVDFGGGLKDKHLVDEAFQRGVSQVTLGTIAIDNPTLSSEILGEYGPEKIILGADVLDFHIATHGWQNISDTHIDDFIGFFVDQGLSYCICTDIQRDGMMSGSAKELYRHIRKTFPSLNLIASGGVHSVDEINELNSIGCYSAIVGKAYYEKTIDLNQIHKFIC